MAHVELAGDVGGRHDNGEGLLVGITVTLEAAVFLPHLVDAALHLLGFINLGKFFFHLLHSFSGQKRFAPSFCSGRTCQSAVPPEFPLRDTHCLCNGRTRRPLL